MSKLKELQQDLDIHLKTRGELIDKVGLSYKLYTRNKFSVKELIDTYTRLINSIELEMSQLKRKK
jgi:hypothetical protein